MQIILAEAMTIVCKCICVSVCVCVCMCVCECVYVYVAVGGHVCEGECTYTYRIWEG